MTFFPIYLFLIEKECTLFVGDTPPSQENSLLTTSPELQLQKLLKLLAQIQKAAFKNFSITIRSQAFTHSPFFTHDVTSLQPKVYIPAGVNSIQNFHQLALYIHSCARQYFPQLFTSPESIGETYCLDTVKILIRCKEDFFKTIPLTPKKRFLKAMTKTTLTSTTSSTFLESLTESITLPAKKRKLTMEQELLLPQEDEPISPPSKKVKKPIEESGIESSSEMLAPSSPKPLLQPYTIGNLSLPDPENASSESSDNEEIGEKEAFSIITPLPIHSLPSQQNVSKSLTTSDTSEKKPSTSITSSATETTSSVQKLPFMYNFVKIICMKNRSCVTFLPKKSLFNNSEFFVFLESVETALELSSYECRHSIPEISPRTVPNNRKLLLKALYSTVLRNYYFFTTHVLKAPPLPELRHAKNEVLQKLEQLYCKEDDADEPADYATNLATLKALDIDPLNPPSAIVPFVPFLWITLVPRRNTKVAQRNTNNAFFIRTLPVHTDYGLSKQIRDLTSKLSITLLHYKTCSQQKLIFLETKESAIGLTHAQKDPLTPQQALEILSDIFAKNILSYKNYFSEVIHNPSTPTMKLYLNNILESMKAIRQLLNDWKVSISKEKTPAIPSASSSLVTRAEEESFDDDDVKDITSKKEKKVLNCFMVLYHESYKNFSISPHPIQPTPMSFLTFLSHIERVINIPNYTCTSSVSGIPIKSDNDPKKTLNVLFLITCRYTAAYKKGTSFTPPSVVEKLTTILSAINTAYYALTTSEKTDPTSYHPDLQPIALKYKISSFLNKSTPCASFTIRNMTLTAKTKTLHFFSHTYYHPNPGKLFNAFLNHLRFTEIQLLRLFSEAPDTPMIITSEFMSFPPSYNPLLPFSVTKNVALQYSKEIFLEIKEKILNDKVIAKKKFCQSVIKKIESLCKSIDTNLADSSSSQSKNMFLFQVSKKNAQYLIKIQRHYPPRPYIPNTSVYRPLNITSKWLSELLKLLTQPSAKVLPIYYFNTLTNEKIPLKDLMTVLPFIYRGLHQNLLQLEKTFLSFGNEKKYRAVKPSFQTSLSLVKASIREIRKCWKETQRTTVPKLKTLPPLMQDCLLKQEDLQRLRENISSLRSTEEKSTNSDLSETESDEERDTCSPSSELSDNE